MDRAPSRGVLVIWATRVGMSYPALSPRARPPPAVVPTAPDPGVRLVSVLDDDMRHVGQAACLRGILLRRG
jgi:hypothetical protein